MQLSTDPAEAGRQLKNKLRATFQALEASQRRLTAPDHVRIVQIATNAAAALRDGDLRGIERSLEQMSDAAAILARAGERAVA